MLHLIGSSASRSLCLRSSRRVLSNISYNNNNHGVVSASCNASFHSSAQQEMQAEAKQDASMKFRRRKHKLSDASKAKVHDIFERILWLDMIELHLMTEIINKKMGIILTDKERAALQKEVNRQEMGESGAGAAEEAEEEDQGPKTVDLKLTGFDAKSKIKVIKECRSIAGLGLKEAKELVEGAPKVVMKDINMEMAEELKEKLEAVGAEVEIVAN